MKYISQITFAILSSVILVSMVNAQPASGSTENRPEGRRERSVILAPEMNDNAVILSRPQSLELRCRGGAGLQFQAVGSRTHTTGAAMTTMELAFSPNLQGGGPLQPGECEFVQRTFYLDEVGQVREPLKVRFETPANAQLKQTQSGSGVDRSSTRAERFPDAISIPEYLNNPDRFWSFQVANSGQGYFLASAHGYWKSAIQESSVNRSGGAIFRKY